MWGVPKFSGELLGAERVLHSAVFEDHLPLVLLCVGVLIQGPGHLTEPERVCTGTRMRPSRICTRREEDQSAARLPGTKLTGEGEVGHLGDELVGGHHTVGPGVLLIGRMSFYSTRCPSIRPGVLPFGQVFFY